MFLIPLSGLEHIFLLATVKQEEELQTRQGQTGELLLPRRHGVPGVHGLL